MTSYSLGAIPAPFFGAITPEQAGSALYAGVPDALAKKIITADPSKLGEGQCFVWTGRIPPKFNRQTREEVEPGPAGTYIIANPYRCQAIIDLAAKPSIWSGAASRGVASVLRYRGGLHDADIAHYCVAMAEADDGTIEDQLENMLTLELKASFRWSVLSLSGDMRPESIAAANVMPALVQKGKSVHGFVALTPTNRATWTSVQQHLVVLLRADPAIANVDRLMRMPGVVGRRPNSRLDDGAVRIQTALRAEAIAQDPVALLTRLAAVAVDQGIVDVHEAYLALQKAEILKKAARGEGHDRAVRDELLAISDEIRRDRAVTTTTDARIQIVGGSKVATQRVPGGQTVLQVLSSAGTLPKDTMVTLADGGVVSILDPSIPPEGYRCYDPVLETPTSSKSASARIWRGGRIFSEAAGARKTYTVARTYEFGFSNAVSDSSGDAGGTTSLKNEQVDGVPPEDTGGTTLLKREPEKGVPPELQDLGNEHPCGPAGEAAATEEFGFSGVNEIGTTAQGEAEALDDSGVPELGSVLTHPTRTRTASPTWVTVNAKRLTDAVPDPLSLLPPEGGIVVVRSPQETGKTHLAAQVARELLRQFPNDAQVAPTHRVALVRDLGRRLGFTSYDVDATAQRVATTLDSLCRVPTYSHATDKAGQMKDRDFSLVVLDEVTQVLRHLVGGTIGSEAPRVISHLQIILRQAKHVLVMDADANDETVEILRLLDPANRPVVVIDNTWRPADRAALLYEDRNDHAGAFVADVKAGMRVAYFTCAGSSRAACVAEMAANARPGVALRVYSRDTSKLPDVQDELADINVATPRYAVLIATPTLGSGVDIQDMEIDRVYLDVPSHDVGADEAVQLGFRVRHPKDRQWRVWVDPRKQNRLTNASDIQAELLDVTRQTRGVLEKTYQNAPTVRLVSGIEMAALDPLHLDLYCRARAHIHRQTNDLAEALRARLKEAGFAVTDKAVVDPLAVKSTRDEMTAAKATTKTARASRVAMAKDIERQVAEDIRKSRVATQDEIDAAERAEVRDYYGMVPDMALVLEDNRGALRPKVANLAVHLLARNGSHLDALMRDVRRLRGGLTAQMKGYYIAAKLLPGFLAHYGIPKGTQVETWTAPLTLPSLDPADKSTATTLALIKRFMGVSHRPKTATVAGKTVRIAAVDSVSLLSRVLAHFGLGLEHVDTKTNGQKVRTYQINTTLATRRIALAQASMTRLQVALQELNDQVKPVPSPSCDDDDLDRALAAIVNMFADDGDGMVASGGTTSLKNKTEEVVPPVPTSGRDEHREVVDVLGDEMHAAPNLRTVSEVGTRSDEGERANLAGKLWAAQKGAEARFVPSTAWLPPTVAP